MIGARVEEVMKLLARVKKYESLITADSFEPDTITDMKDNAKNICDQAKDEVDQIQDEIDQWE